MIIVPRQAQGKHREKHSKREVCFLAGRQHRHHHHRREPLGGPAAGKTTRLFAPFDTKNAIILPRQARDRHREKSKKATVFLQDTYRNPSAPAVRAKNGARFSSQFRYGKEAMVCQDRLGTHTHVEN